jgi:hypothetical protein
VLVPTPRTPLLHDYPGLPTDACQRAARGRSGCRIASVGTVSTVAFFFAVTGGVIAARCETRQSRTGKIDQLLVRRGEDARRRWLNRRQAESQEPSWWLHLLLMIDERWELRPAERATWAQLKV